ncbi:6-phosphogluconolactonase [Buchnera aphidicola (Eriosoma grossulariae)]|uniref:beta-propeller fold lactonase family protein n=1 Tax=Buchnera aphidicola TaxID=9 RepID=UPI0034641190
MYQYVYISTTGSNQIEVWQLNENGILKLIQIIPINGQAQPIKIFKEKNILYVGIRPENKIICYQILESGMIKEIFCFKINDAINYLAIHKNKQLLIYSSYHSGLLTVILLNKLGYPKKIIKNIYNLDGCHSCVIDYSQKFLFVSALKKDKIYLYNFYKQTICINNNQQYVNTNKKSGPRHIVCHPNKKNLYHINELNGTIDAWHIDHINNSIKHIQNIIFIPKNFNGVPWSSEIRISPTGKYLYATDRNTSMLFVFKINLSNGFLMLIQNINTELQPRSFDIDMYGKYLIVAGEKSNFISIYCINLKTGFLKLIQRYPVGKNPLWISIKK